MEFKGVINYPNIEPLTVRDFRNGKYLKEILF